MSGGRGRPASQSASHPIHVVPRSVLAAAPSLVPAIDALLPEGPRPHRASVRRRLAALLAAALIVGAVAVAFAGTRVVLARFTDAAPVGSNAFATGTWGTATTWYLHNNPTPPTANTTAQFNLPLNATAPTATTLRNYDTNCDSRTGRSFVRGTGLVGEATTCNYATWRSAALAAARTLTGTATLKVWARKTTTGGTTPTLRAFLRAWNPATSTYTELGTANVGITNDSSTAFALYSPTWTLSGVGVPAGRQIELKIVLTGGNRDVEIAYDTTANPSSLTLP